MEKCRWQEFIYMSLVPGKTLQEIWTFLTTADKASIRDQLGRIVAALRRITQGSFYRYLYVSQSCLRPYQSIY